MTNKWNVTLDEDRTLQGEEAFNLFLQGKDAWNAFMEEHPETYVNFNGFDFSSRSNDISGIDFSLFYFPSRASFNDANFRGYDVLFDRAGFNGAASFSDARFEGHKVSFDGAMFNSGGIFFINTEFRNEETSFQNTSFGQNKVFFNNARFNGKVLFNGASFEGDTSFNNAIFGNGEVSFKCSKFDNNIISFIDVEFGDGEVSFSHTEFKSSNVKFVSATFGNGNKSFACMTFDKGRISFLGTEFGDGDISFEQVRFGDEEVSFSHVKFGYGSINFNSSKSESLDFSAAFFNESSESNSKVTFLMERAQISNTLLLPNLDFHAFGNVSLRGTSIGTLFDIEGSQFGQLPDLTATTINGHFSVDRIHVDTPKTFTKGDATKARRLKELAKKSEDRKTQLDMLALELDAMTATKEFPLLSRLLNKGYKWISNYGRSILRPTIALALVFSVCTVFYASLSNKEGVLTDAAQLSLSQSLPFLSLSRTVTQTSLTALYGVEEPNTKKQEPTTAKQKKVTKQKALLNNNRLENVGLLQNLLSYICLFFIGLGIRNRFKL